MAIVTAFLASFTLCQLLDRMEYPIFEKVSENEKRKARKGIKKEKRVEKKISNKDHAFVVIFILFLALPSIAVSLSPFNITKDWKETLIWMNENLESQNYLKPYEKPDYAVLSWWDYGNWILFVAKKAVVCNNFQKGAEDAAKFFTAMSEEEAMEIVKKRGVKYIITVDELTVTSERNETKFIAIMQIAGYRAEFMSKKELLDFFNNTMLYQLHVENAKNLTNFVLLKDFNSVKLFKVV